MKHSHQPIKDRTITDIAEKIRVRNALNNFIVCSIAWTFQKLFTQKENAFWSI